MATLLNIAQSACDQEPIHVPGAIQPHGLLLIVDPATGRIASAAGDAYSLIGAASDPIGKTVFEVLGCNLDKMLDGQDFSTATEPLFVEALEGANGKDLDILAHRSGDRILIELEPAIADRPSASRLFAKLRQSIDQIRQSDTQAAAAAVAAHAVQAASGYSRVVVYRFLRNASGEVIGESCASPYGSLLGRRFPAGDIPAQARALYLRSRIRVIPDACYSPATTRGVDAGIDLSNSSLRSVSPVHRRYLQNMGVAASMSVSLIRNGQLWGLIACHHNTPRLVPYEIREVCKHIAREFTHQLDRIEDEVENQRGIELTAQVDHFVFKIASQGDKTAALQDSLNELQAMFGADAAALSTQGLHVASGHWPADANPAHLLEALQARNLPFATDCLEDDDPNDSWRQGLVGRLIFVSTGGAEPACLALLRHLKSNSVEWAGDPDISPATDPATGQIQPRQSFDICARTLIELPRPWMQAERAGAERLARLLERLLRQQRVGALQAELIHVSRVSAMGALASSLAHELNQPLTALANYGRGVSRLLQDRGAAGIEDALGYLDQMTRASIRAGQVVRRLRAMVTKAPMQYEVVLIASAVDSALFLALPDARVRGIAVVVDIEPVAEQGFGDTVQVEQVLTNLIRNAAEALKSSVPRKILIRSVRRETMIELSVADTGPGIPVATRGLLFAPFNSSKETGMGIGLSISRTIVELHGGRIWADDESPEGGACFRFTLPLPPP